MRDAVVERRWLHWDWAACTHRRRGATARARHFSDPRSPRAPRGVVVTFHDLLGLPNFPTRMRGPLHERYDGLRLSHHARRLLKVGLARCTEMDMSDTHTRVK